MNTEALKHEVDLLADTARLRLTGCGRGTMPFRIWGDGEPVVVLVHGGSGSWTHWIRNIPVLAKKFTVVAPDLPGLGESAALDEGYTAQDAAAYLYKGMTQVLGSRRFHLVAFSWGCTVSALAAAVLDEQIDSLLMIGPAAMGMMPRRSNMQPLIKRTRSMSDDEIHEANRENLARLMIHDRDKIDDMAVYLQTWNTNRARFNSPQFALSTAVLDGLKQTTARLKVIYGEHDAPAFPNFDARETRLREVRPDVEFDIIAGAGHWLQYEVADKFNALCTSWIEQDNWGQS